MLTRTGRFCLITSEQRVRCVDRAVTASRVDQNPKALQSVTLTLPFVSW